MKKNLTLAVIFCIGLITIINSCVKDTFTEQDAYREQRKNELLQDSIAKAQLELEATLNQQQILLLDSLKNVGGVINYSVAAVLASDATWISNKGANDTKGLDQVTVTIGQNGQTVTSTTDASGIAVFKDLRIGTINVNISKAGYTEVDFVAELPALPDSCTTAAYGIVRNVGTLVPIFSLTTNLATINGIATVETDLTNNAREVAANVEVLATIDATCSEFVNKYIYSSQFDLCSECWEFDYYGVIKGIAYHSTISTTTTGVDGSFSLQVPSTPDGLPIRLFTSEFAVNQQLLQATLNGLPVWGVQSIRTLYGHPIFYNYSPIPSIGTGATNVQSAYVTISDPSGAPEAQPVDTATATAVLSSSGIVSVNITSPGEGYTQPPMVTFGLGSAFNSVQAEGTAVISNGMVTGVTIDDPGSGYKPADTPVITFTEGVEQQAEYEAEFSFSVIDIEVSDYGDGYSQTPPAVTILGSGTGATAHAVMSAYLDSIAVTATGSGYTQAPQIVISDNFSAWDMATPVMTTNNPLFSIDYNGDNTTLWPASPVPTARVVGDGVGATANLTLSSLGKVDTIVVGAGGSGYNTAPIVTFSGGGGGFGARATATLDLLGAVDYVTIDDPGQGYKSVPIVAFVGGGGTGASASAVLGFPVETISLTAAGLGYSEVDSIAVDNGGPKVNYLSYCSILYDMGLRDITFSDNGWYYSSVPTITINPKDGNGSGATAVAFIQWEINDVVVDNPGSGYKYDNDNNVVVRIDEPGGTGTQATATAILGNGILSDVGPYFLGEGYTAAPNVYLLAEEGEYDNPYPIRQAKMTATVSNGHVTAITITDPGEGYSFDAYDNGAYSIVISTYNELASATAQANPESGQIDYIQIDNPGAGYVIVPTVEIVNTLSTADANMFGSGATATAVITDGRVSAITVNNPGSGYYEAPIVRIRIPTTLLTAVAQCTVDPDGRITGVTFPSYYPYTKGYGYNAVPTVTFTPSVPGKGTGAEGIAILKDGRIDDIVMTNQGSGYVGKNYPVSTQNFAITPPINFTLSVTAGKTYIRDIYFGTGQRTIEE